MLIIVQELINKHHAAINVVDKVETLRNTGHNILMTNKSRDLKTPPMKAREGVALKTHNLVASDWSN